MAGLPLQSFLDIARSLPDALSPTRSDALFIGVRDGPMFAVLRYFYSRSCFFGLQDAME
jgi:hypothetical protein